MRDARVQEDTLHRLVQYLEQRERELEEEYKAQHLEALAEIFADINKLSGFNIYWKLLKMDISEEWEDIMFITGQIAAVRELKHRLKA